jgi:hypothetical protein
MISDLVNSEGIRIRSRVKNAKFIKNKAGRKAVVRI